MAKTTTATLTAELAATLGCKPQFVATRLAFLGFSAICKRCGGSGHHSYNPTNGTVCFGCGGSGKGLPSITRKLIEAVRETVAAGKLAPYLETLTRRAEAKRIAGPAVEQAMRTWENSRVAQAYEARYRKPLLGGDRRWASIQETHPALFAAQVAMGDLYKEARRIGGELADGRWNQEARRELPLTDAETTEAVARLTAIPAEIAALDYDA